MQLQRTNERTNNGSQQIQCAKAIAAKTLFVTHHLVVFDAFTLPISITLFIRLTNHIAEEKFIVDSHACAEQSDAECLRHDFFIIS